MKRFLLPAIITFLLVILLFTQISIRDLVHLLMDMDLLWGGLGALGYLLAMFLRGYRFQWLVHSKEVPLRVLVRISFLHHLSLMVLPSKMGELSYPFFLNKIGGIAMTEGVASLIAARVYDFFTLFLIFLLASVGFQGFFRVNFVSLLGISLLSLVLTFLLFYYMGHLMKGLSDLWRKISSWTGAERKKPVQWIQRKMDEVSEDFHSIKARKTFLPVAITSLLSWVLIFWMCYAFLRGFGVNLSFFKTIFGSTFAIVANALPISGLGNWGTLEAGWSAGFMIVGLAKEKAITTGFGLHILAFLICTIAGLISWVTLKK